jgi:hypothetical protein
MSIPILAKTTYWLCASCGFRDLTSEAQPHSRYHDCPAQRGLSVPLTEVKGNVDTLAGEVRHVVVEREDYEGDEHGLRHDADGRSIQAVRTERADGSNDCHVFPAAAIASTIER